MTLAPSVRSLRSASCSAQQLRDAGCDAKALMDGGFSLQQLRGCGCTARQLMRQCGIGVTELRAAGYSAADCIAGGVSVRELSQFSTLSGSFVRRDCCSLAFAAVPICNKWHRDGCYTLHELRQAHVTARDALAAGFTVRELCDAG
jgi:ribosomal protein L13E